MGKEQHQILKIDRGDSTTIVCKNVKGHNIIKFDKNGYPHVAAQLPKTKGLAGVKHVTKLTEATTVAKAIEMIEQAMSDAEG